MPKFPGGLAPRPLRQIQRHSDSSNEVAVPRQYSHLSAAASTTTTMRFMTTDAFEPFMSTEGDTLDSYCYIKVWGVKSINQQSYDPWLMSEFCFRSISWEILYGFWPNLAYASILTTCRFTLSHKLQIQFWSVNKDFRTKVFFFFFFFAKRRENLLFSGTVL